MISVTVVAELITGEFAVVKLEGPYIPEEKDIPMLVQVMNSEGVKAIDITTMYYGSDLIYQEMEDAD